MNHLGEDDDDALHTSTPCSTKCYACIPLSSQLVHSASTPLSAAYFFVYMYVLFFTIKRGEKKWHKKHIFLPIAFSSRFSPLYTRAAGWNSGYTCMHIHPPSPVCQFWLHTSWRGKVHEVAFLPCAVESGWWYAWLRWVVFGEIRASLSATV